MYHPLSEQPWLVRALDSTAEVPPAVRGQDVPARVPGCVHTDLIRAGLLGHPNHGDNENRCAWVGATNWHYRTAFELDTAVLDHERVDLVCDGLDTIAEIIVNDQLVGQAANMHHPHRFDVHSALSAGHNELVITFRSPLQHTHDEQDQRGWRPVNGDWGPYAYIRKMACNFGWDWGPMMPTVGIWRTIGLHAWNTVRLASVRPLISRLPNAEQWRVEVCATLEWAGPGRADRDVALCSRVSLNEQQVAAESQPVSPDATETSLSLTVDNPRLWWPRGYGEQPLYRLETWLRSADAEGASLEASNAIDQRSMRIGFRTVSLDARPDEIGSAFTLRTNDRPVFCMGANWIPEGLFPSELTPAHYRRRIEQACDANMNMLRVWAGGIYEDPAFYDACDELGVLIWQDFMFACATYPEEQPYPALVEAEARHNIARLCAHPSVAFWCGGNECVWAYQSWGFKHQLRRDQTWGRHYYFELLPQLVAELDSTRPYWPNSPYSGSPDADCADPNHGNHHTWNTQTEGYRGVVPRFVSEFGHQSPPNIATLREALPPDELEVNSAAMRHRQRAGGGNEQRYDVPLATWFAQPSSFAEWHYLAQLLQARSISLAIEWWRANRPRCMGVLYWQLNDCWAGHSWSAIDCAGRRKPLWYATRRAFAPRLLTIHLVQSRPTLFAVNDTDQPWRGTARLRRMRLDGEVFAEATAAVHVTPRTSLPTANLADVIGQPRDDHSEMVVVDLDGLRACFFHDHDKHLAYPPPEFAAQLTRDGNTHRLHVEAKTLLRDVVLAVDQLDPQAEVDDHLVTLLPGETATLKITSAANLTLESLTRAPVFHCANSFGSGRGPSP